jgi:transposase InsO family protein
MICASVKRLFLMCLLLQSWRRLYITVRDFAGGRSTTMRRGFLYLVAITDWHTRKVLFLRISNTLEADFCIEAQNEAIHKLGLLEIVNTDQCSQFTSSAWTGRLRRTGERISMDGNPLVKLCDSAAPIS